MTHSSRRIALYGGSFDPVHRGHLQVARAAAERFALDRVYFVPADVQPLKAKQKVTHYYHRYAMLSLALAAEESFAPSLLEAPEVVRAAGREASYTVDTVGRMRERLDHDDQLFFLIGMDAFAHIGKWREAERLLRSVEFIVASRPGYELSRVADALPAAMKASDDERRAMLEQGTLRTHGAIVHLLPDVAEEVSATEIRQAAQEGCPLESMVTREVAAYIRKLGLYGETEDPGAPEPPRS